MIRFADKNDIPRLKEIWRECFHESGDFFFERMFKNCLVFEKDKICAMLHILEYECDGKIVHYLYGIGTTEIHRGKGIAAQLIECAIRYAESLNVAFVMLVPQEESLFDYYKRFGFEKNCLRALSKPFEFNLKKATISDIPKLNTLYEEKCAGILHITRNVEEWEIILTEGYDVFVEDDKYVISANGIILETNIACEYAPPAPYAAFLNIGNVDLKNGYFNILHD